MTVRRNDTGTALRKGFARPPGARPSDGPRTADEAPPTVLVTEQKTKPARSKFTVLLDLDTTERFDDLAKLARRATGRTVGKADILRALILLASDDASLREQLWAELTR